MNNRLGLGVFGTFGEPYGYQQVFYYDVSFSGSLDLDENEIEFYPGDSLYSVKRELVDGVYTICFCMYSYVRELNTERFGTFLGTSVVLQDGYAEADYIYKALKALHEHVIASAKNVENSILIAPQAADVVVVEPEDLLALRANVIPISKTPFFSASVDEDKKHFVTPNPLSEDTREVQLIHFFDKALKDYNNTAVLYFSFDRNVYEFVDRARTLFITDWDEYVEYKSAPPEAAVVRTKKGINRMAAGFDFTDRVESSQEQVAAIQEEETSEWVQANSGDVERVAYPTGEAVQEYDDDPYRPFDLWDHPVPESGWPRPEAEYRVREYNRLFKYTNTLIEHIHEPSGRQEERKEKRRRRKEEQQNIDNVIAENYGATKRKKKPSFLLVLIGILVLGGGAIALKSVMDGRNASVKPVAAKAEETMPAEGSDPAMDKRDSVQAEDKTAIASDDTDKQSDDKAVAAEVGKVLPMQPIARVPTSAAPAQQPVAGVAASTGNNAAISSSLTAKEPTLYLNAKEIHPRPNMEMTQKDIAILREMGVKNKTVAELTRLLFDNVPSNIGNIYRGQETEYGAALLNANKQAFRRADNEYICTSDVTALHIPAYKSPRLPAVYPK